jgi:hypothetical protein
MKKINKSAVVINYISLIFILAIFYTIKILNCNNFFLLLEIVPLIAITISFNIAFKKSGLWKLVHRSQKKLDERELQIVHKAVRYSYIIFVIISLALIYLFAVAEGRPIDVLLAASLIYLAHTLPAIVIAFSKEEI